MGNSMCRVLSVECEIKMSNGELSCAVARRQCGRLSPFSTQLSGEKSNKSADRWAQIIPFFNSSIIFHYGAKLSSFRLRCQIVLFYTAVPNCLPTWAVSKCPRCQVVPGPIVMVIIIGDLDNDHIGNDCSDKEDPEALLQLYVFHLPHFEIIILLIAVQQENYKVYVYKKHSMLNLLKMKTFYCV